LSSLFLSTRGGAAFDYWAQRHPSNSVVEGQLGLQQINSSAGFDLKPSSDGGRRRPPYIHKTTKCIEVTVAWRDFAANRWCKMIERKLTLPEIMLIGGTRVALGAGIGLLLSNRLNKDQRKAAGLALALVGGLTTIPLALGLIGRGRGVATEIRPAA
jgi:hypothetical protein